MPTNQKDTLRIELRIDVAPSSLRSARRRYQTPPAAAVQLRVIRRGIDPRPGR
jgi:hypothetical protein